MSDHTEMFFSVMLFSFTVQYPNVVRIDCAEFSCQEPCSLIRQSQSFSNYKHHTSFKSLTMVNPNGAISFPSDSDKQIGFVSTIRRKVTNKKLNSRYS